jgi:uncharacterized protein (DUF58 family)
VHISSILDPVVLSSISDLELVARVTVDGTISGLHRSPFHGFSAEFSQYRQYRPGDDLKYVDWKLFARTDRFYTRQYRETTNMPAQIVVDASASMGFSGSRPLSKLHYARILAAALAYLLGSQGDAVGLVTYDSALRDFLPSRPGRVHARRIYVALSRLEASGGTAAASALRRAIDLLKRRGLLVLVSDLYDDGEDVAGELKRAVRMGHEVACLHVTAPDERTLPYRSDVELEDLETGERVLTGAGVRQAYEDAFAAFLERWRRRCASHGIGYARVGTDQPLDGALRAFLLARGRSEAR